MMVCVNFVTDVAPFAYLYSFSTAHRLNWLESSTRPARSSSGPSAINLTQAPRDPLAYTSPQLWHGGRAIQRSRSPGPQLPAGAPRRPDPQQARPPLPLDIHRKSKLRYRATAPVDRSWALRKKRAHPKLGEPWWLIGEIVTYNYVHLRHLNTLVLHLATFDTVYDIMRCLGALSRQNTTPSDGRHPPAARVLPVARSVSSENLRKELHTIRIDTKHLSFQTAAKILALRAKHVQQTGQ